MAKLLELKIDSLRVSLTNQQRIVVLKQVDVDRYLPIWIGPYEAEAITIALQEIEVSRPQTHDLLTKMVSLMDGRLVKVVINALKDDIFYGTLIIERDGKEIEVDSRPSDALAIAVRAHVPIMVSSKVMDEASIIPEEIDDTKEEVETTNQDINTEKAGGHAKTPSSDERLSIFEEYLGKKPDESATDKDKTDDDKNDSPDID